MSRQGKLCRDKFQKRKGMGSLLQTGLSRQIPETGGYEKLVANRFGVATQGIPVATRTRLLHQNYVATLSKSFATESKKELKEQVATEDFMI